MKVGNIKKISLLFVAILVLVFSCNNKRVFHEVKKFDDFKWHKTDKAVFNFNLQDTSVNYDLVLNLRYIQGFPYKYLHLNIEITDPQGKTLVNETKIQIIEDDNDYIGDGAGSYWDLDYIVPDYPFKEQGIYKIVIEHAMPNDVLTPFNEMGVSILKRNKEK